MIEQKKIYEGSGENRDGIILNSQLLFKIEKIAFKNNIFLSICTNVYNPGWTLSILCCKCI